MKNLLKEHANLFTGVTIFLVLSVGLIGLERPHNWQMLILGCVLIAVTVVLFFTARVVLRSFLAFLATLFLSVLGFQMGAVIDFTGAVGTAWFFGTLGTFFITLALSYFMPGGVFNRWLTSLISTITGFALTTALLLLEWFSVWTVILGMILGVLVFLVLHYGWFRLRVRKTLKPKMEDDFTDFYPNFENSLIEAGFNHVRFNDGYILAYDSSEALPVVFMLIPRRFESLLGSDVDKRGNKWVSYGGKSLNPWLQEQIYRIGLKPSLRGIYPLPIVFDTTGDSRLAIPRVLGVYTPNTTKPYPMGVFTAKHLKQDGIKQVLAGFEQYGTPVSARGFKRLEKMVGETAENGEN